MVREAAFFGLASLCAIALFMMYVGYEEKRPWLIDFGLAVLTLTVFTAVAVVFLRR